MKVSDAISAALNLAVVATLGILVLRPGGVLRNAIDGRRESAKVRSEIREAWHRLISEGERLDSGGGPVVLVEFSDYECGYCEKQHHRFGEFLSSNPPVGIVFRHLPIAGHRAAPGAARAAICAGRQGAFASLHAHLFADSVWKVDTNWTRVARQSKVPDLTAFAECLSSPETAARLREDLELAQSLDITGTPTFVHRRGIHTGMLSDSALGTLVGQWP
jgi:protein-disulfide isomerase